MKALKMPDNCLECSDEITMALSRLKAFALLNAMACDFAEHSYLNANAARDIAHLGEYLVEDLEKKLQPILDPQIIEVA